MAEPFTHIFTYIQLKAVKTLKQFKTVVYRALESNNLEIKVLKLQQIDFLGCLLVNYSKY